MNGIEPLGQLSPAFGLLLGLDKGRGAFTLAALPGRVDASAATTVAAVASVGDRAIVFGRWAMGSRELKTN